MITSVYCRFIPAKGQLETPAPPRDAFNHLFTLPGGDTLRPVKAVAIIPARYASTRFPGKPLARETGKYLIQHVCEQVSRAASISEVVVATDDERILDAVKSFGGRAVMTRADHTSGTDRAAECVEGLDLADDDLVINVQGDEPEIEPASLDALVRRMHEATACPIGTLACPFPADGPCEGPGSPADPNCVKVVVDAMGMALYFSRSLIPYPRDSQGRVDDPSRWLLHLGVYAYRLAYLKVFARFPRGSEHGDLEEIERLEQLRALARESDQASGGGPIAVAMVDRASIGIDTPEDYAAFVERCRRR